MIRLGDKEIKDLYLGDKPVTALCLGDEQIWPEEEEYNIHIKGKFEPGTPERKMYMYINGKKITLDEEFDYKSDDVLLYGVNSSNADFFPEAYGFLLELSFLTDTSELTLMKSMFQDCSKLTTLNLGNKFDTSKVTTMSKMFDGCSALATVTGKISNIKVSLDLGDSPLTTESAMVFINGLSGEVTGQTLTLKSTTYNSLTPEQLAVGTAKGWTIASK